MFQSCLPLVIVYFTLLWTLHAPLPVSSSDLHSGAMGRKSCLYVCHDPRFVLHSLGDFSPSRVPPSFCHCPNLSLSIFEQIYKLIGAAHGGAHL